MVDYIDNNSSKYTQKMESKRFVAEVIAFEKWTNGSEEQK